MLANELTKEEELPYRRLWFAIIEQAIHDILNCKGEIQSDAIKFVASDYFNEVCLNIDVNPEAIRSNVIKTLERNKQ